MFISMFWLIVIGLLIPPLGLFMIFVAILSWLGWWIVPIIFLAIVFSDASKR